MKQDYGHQAVAVMLSCNGIVLNYAIVMYDKSRSKMKIIQEIADELPVPPVVSCFLCDSWYTCGGIMDAFIKKGFYIIGTLKTNRVLYPCGIKQKVASSPFIYAGQMLLSASCPLAAGAIMSTDMKGASTALKMRWS